MNESRKIALYIDPPSHHFLKDQLFNTETVWFGGDNLMAPYVYLRDFFTSRGIAVHTADYLPEEVTGEQNIYVSMGLLSNYRRVARRKDAVLSAFFAMECPIVEPSLYRALNDVQRYFKRIFSWSDSPSLQHFTGQPVRLKSFRWPQSYERVHESIWGQTERQFLVMINANKLPRIYWQELYTERLRAVEFFARTNEIDLYGIGWEGLPYRVGKTWIPYTVLQLQRQLLSYWQLFYPAPLLQAARRVYKGPTKAKVETLGSYTFALCFENMILKGWLTEKIFDCFFAGAIPIYWGAPDVTEYIPEDCFVDKRKFPTYEELRRFLRSLSPKDILTYKGNARDYLASEKFKPFTKETFLEIFKRIVEEDTGIRF